MLPHKSCEAFLAVTETGSFEQAAIRLCITASAVTLRVQALEKKLGHTLVIRERPCRVTATGQILLEHLQHQRLMEQNLLQQLQGKSEDIEFYKLNIASNADSLETWLLEVIPPILISEKITLNLLIDDQSQTHQLMETGVVNACISSEATNMKGCITHKLGAMRYLMVCTPEFKSEWFKTGLNRENFRHAPAVIFNDKDQLHSDVILKLFGLNMQSYPYHFIPSAHSFAQAISLGIGFGMVPEIQIKQQLRDNLLINLLPDYYVDVDLYWHHWKQQSKQLNKLTNTIIEYAQNSMIQNNAKL